MDGSGNVYVAGYSNATWGSPAQSHSGSGYDVLAAKLDASGTLIWNTFLGGSGLYDSVSSILAHSSGKVYVTGTSDATWGSPLNGFGGAYDAFAAALNGSNGSRLWHTFLGGSDYDNGNAGTIDSYGNVYVAGDSAATWGFPARAYSSGNDSFVAKIGDGGVSTMLASTINASSDDAEEAGPDATGSYFARLTWISPVATSSSQQTTIPGEDIRGGRRRSGCASTAECASGRHDHECLHHLPRRCARFAEHQHRRHQADHPGPGGRQPDHFHQALRITSRTGARPSHRWPGRRAAWTTGTDYSTPNLKTIAPGDRESLRLGQRQQHGLHRHRHRLAVRLMIRDSSAARTSPGW